MTTKAELQKAPKRIPRAETGPLEFEQDWPGVFIRGDNAFGYAMYLRPLLERLEQQALHGPQDDFAIISEVSSLRAIIELLESCHAGNFDD